MHMRQRPRGFTLIELLVVIAVLAILIALLLPAVQKVREAANRAQCLNNVKQIALATHGYHDANRKFPYATMDYQPGETTATYVTGFILILPYLEQDAVARRWNPNLPRNDSSTEATLGYSNSTLQQKLIPTLTCPSMTPPSGPLGAENRAYCSYLFCSGTRDVSSFHYPPEPAFDGVIVPVKNPANTSGSPNSQPTNIAAVLDGTSNTLLVGETDFVPRGVPSTIYGGVWAYGYIGYAWGSTFHAFNRHDWPTTETPYGAFRSQHSGGGNFAFADGSVRFIGNSINRTENGVNVYQALSTRAGGEIPVLE